MKLTVARNPLRPWYRNIRQFTTGFKVKSRSVHFLIAPLPPNWGGARVSAKLFLDYVTACDQSIRHFDLPTWSAGGPIAQGVSRAKTAMQVFMLMFRLREASSVSLLCSKGFGFSQGLAILLVTKLLRRRFYIRFFGGSPGRTLCWQIPVLGQVMVHTLALADGVVVQTQAAVDDFPRMLRGRISVIGGYRDPHPDTIGPAPKRDAVRRFVYTGKVCAEKGLETAIRAFLRLKREGVGNAELEFHLYGAASETLSSQLRNWEGIYYHGSVPNHELRPQLQNYDVYVFPSVYENEGHPGAVIEAMMAGLPVIAAAAKPGIQEVLKDGVDGILVPPNDETGLYEAMRKLAFDSDECARLSCNALANARRFDSSVVLPSLAAALGFTVNPECDTRRK
jgi:glycosyltransferase involved in cell wall biosynthesis